MPYCLFYALIAHLSFDAEAWCKKNSKIQVKVDVIHSNQFIDTILSLLHRRKISFHFFHINQVSFKRLQTKITT